MTTKFVIKTDGPKAGKIVHSNGTETKVNPGEQKEIWLGTNENFTVAEDEPDAAEEKQGDAGDAIQE